MISNMREIKKILAFCINDVCFDILYPAISASKIASETDLSLGIVESVLNMSAKENLIIYDCFKKMVLGYTFKGLLTVIALSDYYLCLGKENNTDTITDCAERIFRGSDFHNIYINL